jgi:DNA-binding CsgD family transcriptional regulator
MRRTTAIGEPVTYVVARAEPVRMGDDRQVTIGAPPSDARPLLGRQLEQRLISSLLADIGEKGGALVLSGDPGIGKSRLLAEAAALAEERGITILSASGVHSEAELAFAGLHLLLRPVRAHAATLPAVLATALDTAFGLTDEPAPAPFRIAMAVLDLLSEASTDRPLLLLIEDAQWLDRPTADVLAFVARRLDCDPIVLLAATRDGYDSPLLAAGISHHRIDGLDDTASVSLLETTAGGLPAAVHARILREAAGNPLALLELPISARRQIGDAGAGDLPLTARLERAFAERMSELGDETRLLLLMAAVTERHDLTEILAAAGLVSGKPMTIEMLEPAAQAGIVELDIRSVRFRHPLMRSAVRDSASVAQRRRAHQAFAEILEDDPDRRVWHRAALLSGAHEDVALELEEAGRRAHRRGALHVAITALARAAELSDADHRTPRLLAVGELAIELGQPALAAPLLREVDDHSGPIERARATWIEEMISPPDLGAEARIARVVDAAERAGDAGDRDLHINLIWLAVSRAWWTDPGPAARRILVDAAGRLGGPDAPDPRVLAIYTCADPPRHAAEVLPRLQALAASRAVSADAARHLGPAAIVLGAFDTAAGFLADAADGARTAGRLGQLPRMLVLHGIVAAFLGEWDVAVPAGEEARRLATELDAPLWIAGGETVLSVVAGMRGDADAAEHGAARAEQLGLAAGGRVTVAIAQFGRVLSALGESRHDDAYTCARRLFEPADPAHHPVVSGWLIGDLAEAALHTERVAEARQLLAQVEATAGPRPAVWIELNLRYARALLAPDESEAQQRFDDALAADFARWPFQRARLLLAHGEWLRRRRRVAESRAPLRSARDLFDTLGCISWSDRARRELRASGESSRRRDPAARDQLTAQELQIAQLAAEGLSNRQIGQRLYVSHRTISTHLYRIFPKLGITARSELAAALTGPGEHLSP